MSDLPNKSLLASSFYDNAKINKKGLYWITPVFVLVLYLLVMTGFFWLQQIHKESVMFVTVDEETKQERLMFFVMALSFIIIISLLALWRYTRFRSNAEAALLAETSFRRAMENSMSTGMRVLDMQGRIAYVNPAFCRMMGWNEADLLGKSIPYPYWVPGKYDEHQRILDILMSGKTPSTGLEVEAQRRDGSRFTSRMYVSPLRDPNGEQIGWMTSMTDITEPKRVREALTAAHERFMTVLEGLDDAISVVADTPAGLELLFANRTYRRLFGSQPNGHSELMGGRRGRFSGVTIEQYAPSADCWFEVHHRMLIWTDGRKVRMQVARDITERRKHEEDSRIQQEKIQLTSRLTTMGEMASSLAHELNQPLTAIANYNMAIVAMIKSGNISQEKLLSALEKSANQAERAGKIISRIREFVKRSEPRRQSTPVSKIIDNTLDLAEIDARKRRIKIEANVPDDLPNVLADPILIEQVLLNLVKNGLEAMVNSEADTLYVNAYLHDKQIEVRVVDRGHGLKEPERLFEPFFSTKSEGLGMGLNICRTIIESHHGRLWAETNPEGGTIFRFLLPCAPKEPIQEQ
ncbi:PAS domain S-box protein [Advenella alkanexedens]|jgi:PAS domain S-box-containing protein|uniref:histidine kinase n=1 Tax=Advenella alkanexedens TaxID=1481665 RepID=A0ABS6NP02_9BURK|nr:MULTISPECIES: PAS domain-containing sensor histidine kinase [Advenella]MBV4397338.1 PAS domain S-box protein [Advenella alkanexedens]MDD3757858.1 PAS domain S-box protein [Advenella sp.]NLN67171.1 PAS domain S-box protein [Alcaligenaceae bacterium]WKU18414.1 PAS domain S-box protein [Advenella alkanexedens]